AAVALPPVAAIGLGPRSLSRPVGVVPAAALVGAAVLAADLGYACLAALAGQSLPSAPAVIADAFGSALFSGSLALVAYPGARIIRRLTEKRSTFGW
ncbi:MAG: hypothetical protein M3O91_03690, partial [Chloroflexota bacterium]|nr:hypothetical protein [Chloroflexota bacterium]